MTLVVTEGRTEVDQADATTGWSSPVASESIVLFTSDPNPVEDSGCLGIAVSTETSEILFTISQQDFTGLLVYVWILANGTMDIAANGGIAMIIGDGTNTIAYEVAGSDLAVFRHSDGPVGWQCLLLDMANRPAGFRETRGFESSLNITQITEIGAEFVTLSKALGGGANCFIDIIRYGNAGVTIDAGTSGDRGSFAELAVEDRSNTTGKAFGVLRELGTGMYGCQGFLTFGNSGTAAHYFSDTNFVVNWEDRNVASGRYGLTLIANTTGIGSFRLGTIDGTENGLSGGSLIMPTGSGAAFDASDADLDECLLYGVTLKNWTGLISFSDDATNGILHDVFDCIFDTCGQINPGRIDIKNFSVVNSAAAEAMLLDDVDNTLMARGSFTSDGTGHAIKLRPTGAGPFNFPFKGHTFSGYAGTDGSTGNEVVLVDPVTASADVTITVTEEGDTPTIMEAAGYAGTVTILNNKTVVFKGMRDNTEVRIYKTSDDSVVDGIENATAGSPDDREFSWSASAGLDVYYVIHNLLYETIRKEGFLVPSASTTDVIVDQRLDRNYDDPA